MTGKAILLAVISCAVSFQFTLASHFRGAVVQWRPINTHSFDGRIEISHRIGWRRNSVSPLCDSSHIGTTRNFGSGSLSCQVGCSISFSLDFYCTDFDIAENWVSGSKSVIYDIGSSVTYFEATYASCCWITLVPGGSGWSVTVKGTLSPRPDNGRINTSPVTAITPIVRLKQGDTHRISIPHQDADQDVVRCRWATGNECGSVCGPLSGSTLDENACILTFDASGSIGWYAVAIQMEDFVNSTSTTPMSSVPIQFLLLVFADTNMNITAPSLIPGETPADDSCIPVPLNGTYTAGIVAYSGAMGISISNFVTSSPVGLMRSPVTQSMFNSSLYYINVTWTPTANQAGTLQIFCFRARNSAGVESPQSCINFVVGLTGPAALQSSVSPVGTLFSTRNTVWSVTYDQEIRRPATDRYIKLYDQSTQQLVYQLSTRSSAVNFPNNGTNGRTMTFSLSFSFLPGRRYYILMDSGVVVGTLFCLQESPAITNSSFWTFLIDSGSRVNDTVIGDPLYTVPIRVSQEQLDALSLPKLYLCYEVHGTSNQWFNLISDDCVSVNAHYASLNPLLNIMDGVAIRAVDTASQCVNIRVSLDQCGAMVGNTAITLRGKYESNGINVKRYSNRVRISIPNCQDLTLVMWVICESRTLDTFGPPMTGDMIKFVVMRGLNFGSHQAHGLLGQFWNVPVSVVPYHGLLSDGQFQTGWYIVNITTGGTTRSYAGPLHSVTWDQSKEACLYVGNKQAGTIIEVLDPNDPVIEGSFSGYVVKDPFHEDEGYKYGKFDESKCRSNFSF